MTPPPAHPPPERGLSWLHALSSLTLGQVLVIACLAIIAVPVFVIYKAVTGNDELLDRMLSTYEEVSSQQVGCVMRHVAARGGPDQWSISAGFAYQGGDRWSVAVVLDRQPSSDEAVSYCEAAKLVADRLLDAQ